MMSVPSSQTVHYYPAPIPGLIFAVMSLAGKYLLSQFSASSLRLTCYNVRIWQHEVNPLKTKKPLLHSGRIISHYVTRDRVKPLS